MPVGVTVDTVHEDVVQLTARVAKLEQAAAANAAPAEAPSKYRGGFSEPNDKGLSQVEYYDEKPAEVLAMLSAHRAKQATIASNVAPDGEVWDNTAPGPLFVVPKDLVLQFWPNTPLAVLEKIQCNADATPGQLFNLNRRAFDFQTPGDWSRVNVIPGATTFNASENTLEAMHAVIDKMIEDVRGDTSNPNDRFVAGGG